MKNTIIKIGILLLIFITIGLIMYFILDKDKSDELKFKEEYESLNGKKYDNGKKYIEVKISEENNIKYATYKDVINILEGGTGIIYFGFPECPWCRNMVPILLESAKQNEISDIYYFNALSIRDTKELKDGKIITKEKGTKEYYNLIDKLSDYLGPYEGLEDDSIKRLYFPTVVFVMGGEIVGVHIGTVDNVEDPYKVLNKNQKEELLNIYNKYIDEMYGICDENC